MGADDAFAAVRGRLLAEPDAEERVAFACPALLCGGRIVAMRSGDALVVKLPRARCAELVADGVATPFGAGGRTMREWVRIEGPDPGRWTAYAEEALAFARAGAA